MQLEGVGRVTAALSDMEDHEAAPAMLWSLGHVVEDLAARLAAGVEAREGNSKPRRPSPSVWRRPRRRCDGRREEEGVAAPPPERSVYEDRGVIAL